MEKNNISIVKYLALSLMLIFLVPIMSGCGVLGVFAKFEFDKETGTITDYISTSIKTPVIPSKIKGVEVTSIGAGAFHSKKLSSVIIPSSVKNIGSRAFVNNNIKRVTIPSSVTSIGDYAFNAAGLISVTIPSTVTSMGKGAFCYNELTSVTISDGLASIGDYVFERHENDYFSMPIIESGLFEGNNIKNLTIPESVTSIASRAFASNKLTSITIKGDANRFNEGWTGYGFPIELKPGVLEYNGIYIDSNNGEIVKYKGSEPNITIPAEIEGALVTSIGESAFIASNLTSVIIPEGVTKIGNEAFMYNNLTSATIPSSVTIIGDSAFHQNNLTSITIPEGVTSIGDYAFFSNNLIEVAIPSGVTSIGYSSFAHNNLTSITIPEGVTSIGNEAFMYNNLTSVTIPESVISIGNRAFDKNNLTSIAIIGNETRFNENWRDYGFTIELMPGIVEYSGMYFNPVDGEIIEYKGSQSDIVIPAEIEGVTVTKIGKSAFYSTGLTSVIISEGITDIGERAFISNSITSITIPESVTSTGSGAFGWNLLTTVTIPKNITSISDELFICNNLIRITIPENITSIGSRAFKNNNLTSVTIEGDETRFNDLWNSISFPSHLKP